MSKTHAHNNDLTPQFPRSLSLRPKRDFSSIALNPATDEQITAIVDKVCNYVLERQSWYYPFASLQRLTGCRVSEAFNLHLWQINDSGCYTLQPNKGNNLRTFPAVLTDEIEALRVWAATWSSQYVSESNYRRIIRYAFRMFGLVHFSPGGFLLTGCHTFRHAYVKRLLESKPSWGDLLKMTGEKTTKALMQYVNSKFYLIGSNLKF